MPTDLADLIRTHLAAAGKTQAELGRELGLSGQAVGAWLTRRVIPGAHRIAPLSRILGKPVAEVAAAAEAMGRVAQPTGRPRRKALST